MKTEEFIKKVKALGYAVELRNNINIYVENESNEIILCIQKNDFGIIDTDWGTWGEIDECDRFDLLKLAFVYALTPPDERKEETLYYAQHKYFGRGTNYNYLNYEKISGCFDLLGNWGGREYKTQFTKRELIEFLGEEELEKNYTLEEVENDFHD